MLPSFIQLAEADIQRKLKHLPTLRTTAELTFTEQLNQVLGVGFIHQVTINDEPVLVKQQLPTTTITGEIVNYCLEGKDYIKFYPKPMTETKAIITYTPTISPLLVGQTIDELASNWLLAEAPDIYVYAVLTTIAIAINDNRLTVWKAAYDNAIKGYMAVHAIETTRG